MKILVSLYIILFSFNLMAQDSVWLDKGQNSPFSGYLLHEEEVKILRNNTLERDMYKTTNDFKDQQIKLLSDQNVKLATTLESTSSLSMWEKVGYFTAGILVTGLAVKAAHEIYK